MPASKNQKKSFLNNQSAKSKLNNVFQKYKSRKPYMAVYFYDTDKIFITFGDSAGFKETDFTIGNRKYQYSGKFSSSQNFNTQHSSLVADLGP